MERTPRPFLLLAIILLAACGPAHDPPCQAGATRCGDAPPGTSTFTERCMDTGSGLGWYGWNTCSVPLGCVTCTSSLAVCGAGAASCP